MKWKLILIPPGKHLGTDNIGAGISTKQSPFSQEVSYVKYGHVGKFGSWLQGQVSKAILSFIRIFVLQSNI